MRKLRSETHTEHQACGMEGRRPTVARMAGALRVPATPCRTTRPDVGGGEAGRDEANVPGVVGRIVRLKPDLHLRTRSLVPRREGLDREILRKMMKSDEIQAPFLAVVQIV